jgi:competence protein ComEC
LVIDTGPDPLKINQCLHKLKIKKIPLLVLTHFHADHVGGISSVIKDRKIGQVWISNLSEPKASYKSVLTLLKGIELRTVKEGDRFTSSNNNLDIRVLWPRTTTQAFQTLPGDGSTVNNSSISLIIRIKSLSIFVAGDIEPAVQEIITKSDYLAAVDVLKVCHHGSKYQYLPMLDQLKPKIAIISVGAGNSYGHPDPEYINELKRRNIKVLRTDISGGVSLAPPNRIRVTGKEWWQIRWG